MFFLSMGFFAQVLADLLFSIPTSFLHKRVFGVRVNVIEGENVLIRVNNLPENLTTLAWFRGMRIKSPQIGQYTPATKVA